MDSEKKQKTYDKPRITSTVIISAFLLVTINLGLIPLCLFYLGVDFGFGTVFIIIIYYLYFFGAVIAECIVMFPFSILNRKSTLKPVRIVSYVLDGLIIAMFVISIIKIILIVTWEC